MAAITGIAELEQAKGINANKAAWEEADFTEVAAYMRQSGESLVRSLGVMPPMRVLDLGCGDGTTALPLARTGAEVVGIDIASNLVEAGKRRAEEAGLDRLRFQEGDACNLEGVEDDAFDLTLSMFGAIFAPNPFDVAKEMVRVTKPGGRIVMGNWIPNDPAFVVQMRGIKESLLPPPSSGNSLGPMAWGVEEQIIERFGEAGISAEQISMVRDTYCFSSPDHGPEGLVEAFTQFYKPTFDAAQLSEQLDAFQQKLLDLAYSQNQSADGSTLIPSTFLRVTVNL